MKRIILFLVTNLAILVVLGITANLLGVGHFLTRHGLDVGALLGFAAVFGMGGSLLSLAISKWVARFSTGARVIERPADATEAWLVQTVHDHARRAGVAPPEVAVYDAPEANAFATGPSRDNSLVAVSTGLLEQMERDEVDAVLAHEVAHIANGDMVTLTLIQGVVNTFVIVIAKAAGYGVDRLLSGDREEGQAEQGPGAAYFVTSLIAELLLGFLASMVVLWFSRQREFRADAGGAQLAGRGKMIAALERLRTMHEGPALPSQMAAFGINGGGSVSRLFLSHPPLEERIAALRGSEPVRAVQGA